VLVISHAKRGGEPSRTSVLTSTLAGLKWSASSTLVTEALNEPAGKLVFISTLMVRAWGMGTTSVNSASCSFMAGLTVNSTTRGVSAPYLTPARRVPSLRARGA